MSEKKKIDKLSSDDESKVSGGYILDMSQIGQQTENLPPNPQDMENMSETSENTFPKQPHGFGAKFGGHHHDHHHHHIHGFGFMPGVPGEIPKPPEDTKKEN